jgi:hypothetical protein
VTVALDTIFPIVDESSAQLMAVKARCLFAAGLITEAQKQVIEGRAARSSRVQLSATQLSQIEIY